MQKLTKIALATLLAMTAVAGVGCSSKTNDTAASTTTTTSTDKKEDTEKTNRAVFAAALIADEKLNNQFAAVKGLGADGKETSYMKPSKSKDEAVKFLANYWSEDAAGKAFDAVLGDAAYLANVNKEVEAATNKANETAKEKKVFKPLTAVADNAKFKKNDLSGASAQFKDAKIESKDGKFTLEYKGLKYTLEKSGVTYKVTGKEGTLSK